MSELSADEKRRLLRERRQAKMAQGKATERLSNILSQGLSVNSASVQSVLEKTPGSASPDALSDSPNTIRSTQNSASPAFSLGVSHPSLSHDDPEEADMDAIMQKIFSGAGASDARPDGSVPETSQFFAEMMKTMGLDPDALPEMPENASHATQLAVYHEYQQKSVKARFLALRIIVHTANFLYHFLHFSGFAASSHAFVRDVRPQAGSFMSVFISAEISIISGYYLVLSSNGVLSVSSRNHPISKMLSLASAVFPQASALQQLLDSALIYWGGASIVIGDLMLMVVYIGLASILGGV
ncbi:GET complex, subunit GET2 [Metschnikowia bicuspidata var. bicuspidata NRRL YB-4993]|uniref:GET complex, subunit GET2 n=1 Tax=Metschnikowia bicuspidata var. bicuspidata NRRL YB-4993 TaxID=869754 RepID=A0A1A0HAY2_9ASCO|nr:GET complex, subunit GET2 [Metschnikowia bicuspidata var. bicuspidata NRRL YB-4993]OBA21284.1 GET complex, subunit GET2 [Metschnikowia bicuspidata var. bicuspidata NRRL YB-4993]